MKNLIKIAFLTIFIMMLTIGSSIAQVETQSSKPKEKCGTKSCCSKETKAKMNECNIENGKMLNLKSIDKNYDGKIYQCPMCADQISDEKSECGKCGMQLMEVSIKKAKENLGYTKQKMMNHLKMGHTSVVNNGNVDFTSIDKNEDGKVYQCSMCSDQILDKPGECQKCGMQLKEVSIKDANMELTHHKHKTK